MSQDPDRRLVLGRLRFYLPSVTKMATEGVSALREMRFSEDVELADYLDGWLNSLPSRVQLQREASWAGLNDGYASPWRNDPSSPYALLYWDLEMAAKHCNDCLTLSADSPYDPPGSGGHEMNQTPGDGETQCGAGCKCSLRYGYYDGHSDIGGTTGRGLVPDAPFTNEDFGALNVAPPTGDLNDGQKSALDLMRKSYVSWQEYAPDLPDLPTLFDGETPADMPALEWDKLTPHQQYLYAQ